MTRTVYLVTVHDAEGACLFRRVYGSSLYATAIMELRRDFKGKRIVAIETQMHE